jgi:VWFA-related protein
MPSTVRAALCAFVAVFCLVSLSRAARGQDAVPVPAPEHSFILLFDYPAGGLHQIEEISQAVDRWVGSSLLPGDAVAVASFYGCELQIQQDFTRDRGDLSGAIADAVRGRSHAGRPTEAGTVSLAAHLPQGEALAQRTANFYGLLQVLAEASAAVPGRKNLLVFSKGFGRSHLFEEENGSVEHADLSSSGLIGSPIQEKYLSAHELYEPTLKALQEADVTLDPVDLATDYRETYPLAGVMCQLAAGSGGRYFYPVTDVAGLLDRVIEDEKADSPVESLAKTEGTGSAGTVATGAAVAGPVESRAKARE